ncbi:hypothetical protein [Streptomyces virginiae]|uniref:hypothetical protein n=1 Tax=Streptomyces virginiae TaxID=1961 RepID=UPI0022550B1D|nr:hypothetical protein [Streptomyces virginiae]MCX5270982.1 hypothetical protein [Streptomyces virginiae]
MSDIVPANPGWYLRETDGHSVVMDPIVAWWLATDSDDDPILLPLVSGGPKAPVILIDVDNLAHWGRTIVYQPMYIPDPFEDPEES